MIKRTIKLESLSDKILERDTYFQRLKDLSLSKNYPAKVKKIKEKLQEELDLFKRKGHSTKLVDLEKDLNFLNTQIDESNLDKFRIDTLSQKYSIYG